MYWEQGVGLDELQRLLSVKIILVLSNIFFISSTLSKIYSTSAQVTKGIKEERLCIWGFILLFVQAEKLLQNNRYLPLWEDAVPKKRGKKKSNQKPKNPLPGAPSWRLFRSQNSVRETEKKTNKQTVWNSPPKNGVAVEMNAAFATNDSILIYALCISSAASPVVFQLWSSRVKKLTALQMKFCSPVPGCDCPCQPVFASLWDSHRLVPISALGICIRLWNAQGHREWIPTNVLKTPGALRAFRDFIKWLVQIRRCLCEPPLAAAAAAWGIETRFRGVTQCFVLDSTKGKKSSVIGEGWIPALSEITVEN